MHNNFFDKEKWLCTINFFYKEIMASVCQSLFLTQCPPLSPPSLAPLRLDRLYHSRLDIGDDLAKRLVQVQMSTRLEKAQHRSEVEVFGYDDHEVFVDEREEASVGQSFGLVYAAPSLVCESELFKCFL